jgi:hypothetical protein
LEPQGSQANRRTPVLAGDSGGNITPFCNYSTAGPHSDTQKSSWQSAITKMRLQGVFRVSTSQNLLRQATGLRPKSEESHRIPDASDMKPPKRLMLRCPPSLPDQQQAKGPDGQQDRPTVPWCGSGWGMILCPTTCSCSAVTAAIDRLQSSRVLGEILAVTKQVLSEAESRGADVLGTLGFSRAHWKVACPHVTMGECFRRRAPQTGV